MKFKAEESGNFRRENGSLFKKEGNSFVHCYQNDYMSSAPIRKLIAAYNQHVDDNEFSNN